MADINKKRIYSVWWRVSGHPLYARWRLAADTLSEYEVEAVKDALESVLNAVGLPDWTFHTGRNDEPPTDAVYPTPTRK